MICVALVRFSVRIETFGMCRSLVHQEEEPGTGTEACERPDEVDLCDIYLVRISTVLCITH